VVPHDASAFLLADHGALRSQKASQTTTLDSPSLVDFHSLAIPIPWNKDHQADPKCKNGQAAENPMRERTEWPGRGSLLGA